MNKTIENENYKIEITFLDTREIDQKDKYYVTVVDKNSETKETKLMGSIATARELLEEISIYLDGE